MPESVQSDPNTLAPVPDWMNFQSTDIPMLPELAVRVISLVSDPEVTIAQLAQVVSKDQVLTTRLLSLANSAFYGSSVDVATVPEAVMRVGSLAVRNLAVTLCVTSRMADRRIYGDRGQDLVHHGVGTAYLARIVADATGQPPDAAFLGGLLHDIGKMVILKWHFDHTRTTGEPIAPDAFEAVLAAQHASVGGLALRRWGLPPELEEPVVCHHAYDTASDNRPLAATVYLANRLSHRYGFGCSADGYDPLEDPVSGELGLDAAWLADLDARAPGLYEVARQGLA